MKIIENVGIEVEFGVLEKEVKEINKIFFKYIENKIFYFFLKCGIIFDGKIVIRNGKFKWIINEIVREKV